FLLLAFGMLAFGCHEAYTMADISLKRPLQTCSTIFATLLLLLAVFQHTLPFSSLAMAATTLYILACFAILFRDVPNQENVVSTFAGMGIFLYLVWSLISIARLYYLSGLDGRMLLIYMIATTKMADVGAYIVGSATAKMPGGNPTLAPTLSPK
ncbi:MAG: phosphatidate cytidylyltransferase, partial [Victivallales bacterium]|nr:phosphatidate cytidylyltransferase [Victivallales bacterium]